VQLRLSVSGAPHDILQFVYSMENLPYLLFIDTWHLAWNSDAKQTAQDKQSNTQPAARAELTLTLSTANEEQK